MEDPNSSISDLYIFNVDLYYLGTEILTADRRARDRVRLGGGRGSEGPDDIATRSRSPTIGIPPTYLTWTADDIQQRASCLVSIIIFSGTGGLIHSRSRVQGVTRSRKFLLVKPQQPIGLCGPHHQTGVYNMCETYDWFCTTHHQSSIFCWLRASFCQSVSVAVGPFSLVKRSGTATTRTSKKIILLGS